MLSNEPEINEVINKITNEVERQIDLKKDGKDIKLLVTRKSIGLIKTDFGEFYVFHFTVNDEWQDYLAIFKGELDENLQPIFTNKKEVLFRIDSGCATGQLLLDKTCECRDQLNLAMREISENGEGLIIYIPTQDGRGKGLDFKLSALFLQDKFNINNVDASKLLTKDDKIDVRTYEGVVSILKFLGIGEDSILKLETNNPLKKKSLVENGYKLVEMTPILIPPTNLTKENLLAKQNWLGHLNLVPKEKHLPKTNFIDKLNNAVRISNSLVCCGLDPDLERMPDEITNGKNSDFFTVLNFLTHVINITAKHVCAYKIQKAFFEQLDNGMDLLDYVISYIHQKYPHIVIMLDSKIGDIDNTMKAYVNKWFVKEGLDALVVNPYMGEEVLDPFISNPERGAVVLVRTSNPGAATIQSIMTSGGEELWRVVLDWAIKRNKYNNIMPVLPLTQKLEFSELRKLIPQDMFVLFAGYGAQGGKLDGIQEFLNKDKAGFIINSSRNILYPYEKSDKDWKSKVEEAVINMKDTLNSIRGDVKNEK
ncbi:orotidine-5'-phosphate decarboxylase [Candidatus Parvarchaeota archaeon]|nr:orotidine-5'-phosphate decarboxylase [Candidatus Parvarchaeota archaeon]